MRFHRPASLYSYRGLAAVLVAVLGALSTAAHAGYKLQSGDTLEISVVGLPGLRQRAVIGLEGTISVPLVGYVKISGLTLSAAEKEIARDLSHKVYRASGTDGRETPSLILPHEVLVTVAEYRPIYVNGNVAKPGEYAFRPGMTVRQAIAVAGGYGAARLAGTDPYMGAADLRAEYESLRNEFALAQARSWRLHRELDGKAATRIDYKMPAAPSVGGPFMKTENAEYEARLADRTKDAAFLRAEIGKAELQLQALTEKKKGDEEGNRADVVDFNRIRELYSHGLATAVRLSEARRGALLSSDQLLQTIVDISNIERQHGEFSRQLDRTDSQTRIDDLKDLQSTDLHLAQVTARLKSTAEKLAYMGLMTSPLTGGAGAQPEITVHRKGDRGAAQLTAVGEEVELAPGDVVDVSGRPDERIAELLNPSAKPVAEAPIPSRKPAAGATGASSKHLAEAVIPPPSRTRAR